MNLAICHYHLKPGGVTRIIESQVSAITSRAIFERIEIMCGWAPEGFMPANAHLTIDPVFNYLTGDIDAREYKEREKHLFETLASRLGNDTILHMHNPNLGKNPLLTRALWRLARDRYPMVLHCHDFAEDREDNYEFLKKVLGSFGSASLEEIMYPISQSCRYCVLNSADHQRLLKKNMPESSIQTLPNPVSVPEKEHYSDPQSNRRRICRDLGIAESRVIFLYPVRGIRRKNIGELVLLASLFAERAAWIVTLAPQNPVEKGPYETWKKFVREIGAPVIFEAGSRLPFSSLMAGPWK